MWYSKISICASMVRKVVGRVLICCFSRVFFSFVPRLGSHARKPENVLSNRYTHTQVMFSVLSRYRVVSTESLDGRAAHVTSAVELHEACNFTERCGAHCNV